MRTELQTPSFSAKEGIKVAVRKEFGSIQGTIEQNEGKSSIITPKLVTRFLGKITFPKHII